MQLREVFEPLSERLQTSASVKQVFGEPIVAHDRTIIPVARVGYGFGGGVGSGPSGDDEPQGQAKRSEGGGLGGGVAAAPVGVLEITPQETRWIPVGLERKLSGAFLGGLVLGWLLTRCR